MTRPAADADYDPNLTPLEGPTDLPCGHWVHIRKNGRRCGWDLHAQSWQPCDGGGQT